MRRTMIIDFDKQLPHYAPLVMFLSWQAESDSFSQVFKSPLGHYFSKTGIVKAIC